MQNSQAPDFYTWLTQLWRAGEDLSEVTFTLERHYSLDPPLRERLLDAYQNNLSEETRRLRMKEFVEAIIKVDILGFEDTSGD